MVGPGKMGADMTEGLIEKDREGVGSVPGGAWGGQWAPAPQGAALRRGPVGHFRPGTST